MTLRRRPLPAALAAVTAIGAVLRAGQLRIGPRFDESFEFLYFAKRSLGWGLTHYPFPNNHLLNTLAMHVDWRLFGASYLSMRLPAFVAGVALVPAVYFAGRRLYGPAAGLVAAGLIAVSAPMVEYSVNGRGYTMTWLAMAVLVVLTARLLDRRSRRDWGLWVVCAALGVYAIPTMALALAAVVLWFAAVVAWRREARRLWELAAACAGAAVLVFLLYLPVLGDAGWHYTMPLPGGVGSFVRDVWNAAHAGWPAAVRVVLVAAVLAALALHRRVGRQPVPLLAAAAVATAGAAVLLPHPPPFVRAWLFLVPIWLMTAAAGVVACARAVGGARLGFVGPVAVVALVLAAALAFDARDLPSAQDRPVLGAHRAVRLLAGRGPGTTVLVSPLSLPELCFASEDAGVRLDLRSTARTLQARQAVVLVSRGRQETLPLLAGYYGLGKRALRRWRTAQDVDLYEPRTAGALRLAGRWSFDPDCAHLAQSAG